MAKRSAALASDHPIAIGARLRFLRIAFGRVQGHTQELSQRQFAHACGVGVTAYNNAEVGFQRIGLDSANRIRNCTGASLDFIYHDNRMGLPFALAMEIARLETAKVKR